MIRSLERGLDHKPSAWEWFRKELYKTARTNADKGKPTYFNGIQVFKELLEAKSPDNHT